MRILKYIMLVMVAVTFTSCQKDQYYLFNDIARIQFGPKSTMPYLVSTSLADTLKPMTFYYHDQSIVQDTVFFDIYAIGGTSESDRSFKLEQEQVPGAINAIPNKHYVGFDHADATKNFVMKAGTVHTSVPILVLRDESLKTSTVVLKFKVVDNDDFKQGELSNVWRKATITDRLSQPAAWTTSVTTYYFGKYSVEKHKFMIEVTGQKWDQTFMDEVTDDQRNYYITVVKTALIDYNNAHPDAPLRDENEELIEMP